MTKEEKIEALKAEFLPLWEMALNLSDRDIDVAFRLIESAVKSHEDDIIEREQDRWTAQFDANWENIADNH